MAGKRKPPAPPSPEDRDNAIRVLQTTDEPKTARQLSGLLKAPHKIRDADLVALLDEKVAAGQLFRFPGKTAKGKPRYWDRDAGKMARDSAAEALRDADSPLTAQQVRNEIAAPIKLSEGETVRFLDEQVAAGTLYAIPKATAKGKPRYWNRDVIEYGRQAIRQALEAKGQQTEASLKKAAKGLDARQFGQSLERALAAKEAWQHPAVRGTKKGPIGAGPPSPEPYLRDIGKKLGQIAQRLEAAGVSQANLRRGVVQMAEEAGIPIAPQGETGGMKTERRAVPTYDLIAQMKRIEPGAWHGALVTARDLRRATRLEKAEFDRAALELGRQGRLSLHQHDFPTSLSQEERDELVSDGNGAYYIGMAIRQN